MIEKAKTAVFLGIGKLAMENYPIPKAGPGKIVIRVTACGLCTWEQRVYTGVKEVVFPFIGGHEIAGEIIELGPGINTNIWHVGDTVAYGTAMACGDCYFCKVGQEQNCEDFNHSKHLEGLPHKGMCGFS